MVGDAKKKKKLLILLKVDFEKGHDSVEWNYLYFVMTKMSFPNIWRIWILECVEYIFKSFIWGGNEEVSKVN